MILVVTRELPVLFHLCRVTVDSMGIEALFRVKDDPMSSLSLVHTHMGELLL